ncbi:hypothetical protein CHCC14821_0343 [Bacillus paralicheniformis]|nr:hypothetical protein CHCC14821_0343 [Bacillus paralicheniformis]
MLKVLTEHLHMGQHKAQDDDDPHSLQHHDHELNHVLPLAFFLNRNLLLFYHISLYSHFDAACFTK